MSTTPADVTAADLERLRDRLARAAEAADLLDVGYTTTDSPFGPLLLAATAGGLVRLAFAREDHDAVLARLAERVSPRVLRAPARLDGVRRQLDEYFDRRRRDFDLDLDWSLVTPFQRKVLAATAAIPYGEVASYSDVAAATGSPGAARATGNALGANPMPVVVPCHRVVRRGGDLGGYTGGLDRKRTLLTVEGSLGELFPR